MSNFFDLLTMSVVTSGTENGGVLLVWTICGDPNDASIIVNIKSFQLYFYVAQIHSIILLIIHVHIRYEVR